MKKKKNAFIEHAYITEKWNGLKIDNTLKWITTHISVKCTMVWSHASILVKADAYLV